VPLRRERRTIQSGGRSQSVPPEGGRTSSCRRSRSRRFQRIELRAETVLFASPGLWLRRRTHKVVLSSDAAPATRCCRLFKGTAMRQPPSRPAPIAGCTLHAGSTLCQRAIGTSMDCKRYGAQVPASVATAPEGTDYLWHFCGRDCLAQWCAEYGRVWSECQHYRLHLDPCPPRPMERSARRIAFDSP
jgi:hypothetical protein